MIYLLPVKKLIPLFLRVIWKVSIIFFRWKCNKILYGKHSKTEYKYIYTLHCHLDIILGQ